MNIIRAITIVDGSQEAEEEEVIKALAKLVETGYAWTLPGSYGRAAMRAIADRKISRNGEVLT